MIWRYVLGMIREGDLCWRAFYVYFEFFLSAILLFSRLISFSRVQIGWIHILFPFLHPHLYTLCLRTICISEAYILVLNTFYFLLSGYA